MNEEKGILFVVSGPSGVGKGTLLEMVMVRDPRLSFSTSATTRSPRPGEVDGVHYFFMDDARFKAMLAGGEFLEHAFVHGKYYGTPWGAVRERLARGIDVVLDIDVQGAMQVMEKRPESTFIFVAPPGMSPEILRERLENRGTESREVIEGRVRTAIGEMKLSDKYDYVIYNGVLEEAVKDLEAVIRAGRLVPEGRRKAPGRNSHEGIPTPGGK
jgi:guanylate kinase